MTSSNSQGRHAKKPTQNVIVKYDAQDIQKYSRNNYGRKPRKARGFQKRNIVLAIVAALVVFFIGALGINGIIIYSNLEPLRNQANILQTNLFKGNPTNAKAAVDEINVLVKRINNQTKGPQWAVAQHLPIIGNDFKTIDTITSAAESLCSAILVPLVSDMSVRNTGSFIIDDNRLNAEAIQIALDILASQQSLLDTYNEKIHNIEACKIQRLDSLRKQFRSVINATNVLAQASPNLAPHVPFLLGADGTPRNYLFISLNNAELRSIGGLPGSYGILTLDDGKINMGEFLSLKDTPRYVPLEIENEDTETVAPGLTDEERILFGRRVVNVPAETATNPQFARFAESFSWLFSYRGHGETDGVIAMDTTFLESLLDIVGEINTSDGILIDKTNATKILLHDTYTIKPNDTDQNTFFAEVANACFDRVFSDMNATKIISLLKAMWHVSDERHLQVWIPNDQVEQSIEILGFSGSIQTTETEPTLGIYINDDTWSKISWYLSAKTTVGAPTNNPDGSKNYRVTTLLTNHLTENEAQTQPDYVTGTNWRKRSRTDMLDWIFLYAPAGGSISDIQTTAYFTPLDKTRSGFNGIEQTADMNRSTHLGREVWFGQLQISGGEQVTISYTVTTSPNTQTDWLKVDETPTAQNAAGW